MLSDYVISLIRTWVPIGVGVAISYLAAHGLNLDASTQAGAIALFTGLLSAVYYAVVRLVELHFPKIGGVLLGHVAKPSYGAVYRGAAAPTAGEGTMGTAGAPTAQ